MTIIYDAFNCLATEPGHVSSLTKNSVTVSGQNLLTTSEKFETHLHSWTNIDKHRENYSLLVSAAKSMKALLTLTGFPVERFITCNVRLLSPVLENSVRKTMQLCTTDYAPCHTDWLIDWIVVLRPTRHKKTKARFSRLLQHLAWKSVGLFSKE